MFHIHKVKTQRRIEMNYYQLCRCGYGRVVRLHRGFASALSPVTAGWPVPDLGETTTAWVQGPFPEAQEKPVRPPRGGSGTPEPARDVQVTITLKSVDALPAEAHILAAQIDDALRIWTARGLDYRPDVARAAKTAVRRYSLLVDVLSQARNQLERELEDYRP